MQNRKYVLMTGLESEACGGGGIQNRDHALKCRWVIEERTHDGNVSRGDLRPQLESTNLKLKLEGIKKFHCGGTQCLNI